VKKESNRIEKKSALITLILQIVLLCGLFFAVAWKEPNPPIAQYGIELGFEVFTGTEEASPNQTNDSPTENTQIIQEETSNDEIAPNEVTELQEILESTGESQGDIKDQEVETDQIIASSQIDALTDDETVAISDESEQIMEDVESTDKKEEKTEPKDNEAKKMLNMDEEDLQNASLDDSDSELQGKMEQTDSETGSDNKINKIDERALYKTNIGSKQGANEGPELQISGWEWGTQKPRPKDTSDEIVGKVICNIRVDSDGYISAQLDSYTTPPSVAIAYKNSLDGLQLEIKDDGVTLGSMGKVVFILKPKLD
jgi:periplasmic protein TonB